MGKEGEKEGNERDMALDAGGGGGGGGAIRVDWLSLLPEDLRLNILARLPLKEAIRTSVLASEWRDLWQRRWSDDPSSSSFEIYLRPRDANLRVLDKLEKEPRRRIDSFSLIVGISKLRCKDIQRFLKYAADCRVENLHVETRNGTVAQKLKFHLPLSNPHLARLSLRNIGISNMYYKGVAPFRALEIIRLHSVGILEKTFRKMVVLCPNLRTLDLRRCDCDCVFHIGKNPMVSPSNLRSVTIAECDGRASLNAVAVPSLRSFRYSGNFLLAPFRLPSYAVLADLYICFGHSLSRSRSDMFNKALPNDLSGLTVLTICSNALPAVFPLRATAQLPKLSNLHNLRELQLLMLNMAAANLADIYLFLKTCQCANLERIFVQLPVNCDPVAASLDEVVEEPLEVGLENLKIVKFMNFKWRHTEVQLLSFLLRKATSLEKVLLVSPDHALPDASSVQEADQLLFRQALANGKMILSVSDDAATQPYHSEVFIEV